MTTLPSDLQEVKYLAIAAGGRRWERILAGLKGDVAEVETGRRVALCWGLKAYKSKVSMEQGTIWSRKNADFIAAANPALLLRTITRYELLLSGLQEIKNMLPPAGEVDIDPLLVIERVMALASTTLSKSQEI